MGRRYAALAGLAVTTPCILGVMFAQQGIWALILLSLAYGGITFQQPAMFAACLDMGGEYAGAVVGALNTASQMGSLASTLAFGYIVAHFGNYNLPFVPMAALSLLGFLLWLKVGSARGTLVARSGCGSPLKLCSGLCGRARSPNARDPFSRCL